MIVVRNRINRAQMLLPVALLLESLKQCEADLEKKPTDIQIPNTQSRIKLVRDTLSQNNLEKQGLPPEVPAPWTPSADPSVYQSYVQKQSDWVVVLTAITGALREIFELATSPSPPGAAAVEAAVAKVDSLAIGTLAPAAETVSSAIAAAMASLHPEVDHGERRLCKFRADREVPTLAALRVEIQRLAFTAWSFILAATVLSGAYVLIFSASGAGFGTLADYIIRLFWGLGLPTAANQLQSATPQSISAQFGVPKSG